MSTPGWSVIPLESPMQILRPFLGARILKTGLATFIVLVTFHWIGPNYVALAAVAAILTMQPSITDARRLFGEQMVGNLVGGSVGVALALWTGSSPLFMALGVILVLGILVRLNLTEVASLSAVVVIFIMERPHEELLTYSAFRVAAITGGMVVGYLVNRFIRPPRFQARLTGDLEDVGSQMDAFMDRLIDSLPHPERYGKEQIKADAGAILKRLESVRYLLNLSAESEGSDPRRSALTKSMASMFVFTESIMDIHKLVLQVGGLNHEEHRAVVEQALRSVIRYRQAAMTAALDLKSHRRLGKAAAPDTDPAAALSAALEQLDLSVDTLVDRRETREMGMTLHTIAGEIRHMDNRMEILDRLRHLGALATSGRE